MADGGNGFDCCIEVVRLTRGYRSWPDDVQAQSVAESFQPGARVADVARQHDLAAHRLSDWRRQARLGRLILPADAMAMTPSDDLPDLVPVLAKPEDVGVPMDADRTSGVITIEIGNDLVLRVPSEVPAKRAATVARALRGLA